MGEDLKASQPCTDVSDMNSKILYHLLCMLSSQTVKSLHDIVFLLLLLLLKVVSPVVVAHAGRIC